VISGSDVSPPVVIRTGHRILYVCTMMLHFLCLIKCECFFSSGIQMQFMNFKNDLGQDCLNWFLMQIIYSVFYVVNSRKVSIL